MQAESSDHAVSIRFAPITVYSGPAPNASLQPLRPRQIKDRTGCYPCKRRRVKCDEALPTCAHCTRRGESCVRPYASGSPTQTVLRRLPRSISSCRGIRLDGANWELLDYWFGHVCRILCNFPPDTRNPFSFCLLETLADSQAATHTLQSLSSAFRTFFEVPFERQCLEERGKALKSLRLELLDKRNLNERTLLTIVILGSSACWFTEDATDFGLEHLHAANAVLEQLLVGYKDGADRSHLFYTATGMYMYWDMACSFLAPLQQLPVRNKLLYSVAKRMDSFRPPHPVLGVSTELFLVLGSIGRSIRRFRDTGTANASLEAELLSRLQSWEAPTVILNPDLEQAVSMALCLRELGFIMLLTLSNSADRAQTMATHVKTLLDVLKHIPVTSPYFGFQALVLTMASGACTDSADRAIIVKHFVQLYGHNRLRVNYQALEMVRETWELTDRGEKVGLLDVMDRKGWTLMLG